MSPKSSTAHSTFLYLISFVALGFLGVTLGMVVWEVVDHFLPLNTVENYGGSYYSQASLRFAVSAIIVASPIYFFATRQINRELADGRMDEDSAIRRWMTYIILLAAACVEIGYLIAAVNVYLAGDWTLSFGLKVLGILLIGAGFGSYYIFDLRRGKQKPKNALKIFSAVFWLAIVAALGLVFSIIDSPVVAREKREDQQRVNNLRDLSWDVDTFFENNSKLPATLDELVAAGRATNAQITDPVSEEIYGYKTTGRTTFELCANFTHSNEDENIYDSEWKHGVGESCFTGEIIEKDDYTNLQIAPTTAK